MKNFSSVDGMRVPETGDPAVKRAHGWQNAENGSNWSANRKANAKHRPGRLVVQDCLSAKTVDGLWQCQTADGLVTAALTGRVEMFDP